MVIAKYPNFEYVVDLEREFSEGFKEAALFNSENSGTMMHRSIIFQGHEHKYQRSTNNSGIATTKSTKVENVPCPHCQSNNTIIHSYTIDNSGMMGSYNLYNTHGYEMEISGICETCSARFTMDLIPY